MPEPRAPERAPLPSVRETVRTAVDALVESGGELRTLSAAVVLFGVLMLGLPLISLGVLLAAVESETVSGAAPEPALHLVLAAIVAGVVGVVATLVLLVQIPLLIIASVGGRLAGMPLTLRQSLRRSRQVFLRAVAALFLVSLAGGIPSGIVQELVQSILGPSELAIGLNLVATAVFASPWVYVLPGIVLGGVGVGEAMRRSWVLARLRWRIALTIAFLAIIGVFIVVAAALGMVGAVDLVLALGGGAPSDVPPDVPPEVEAAVGLALIVVTLVVAVSIVFAVLVVQYAPQASGFYALTRYADALHAARGDPPEPLFHAPALVFYASGVVASLVILGSVLGGVGA